VAGAHGRDQLGDLAGVAEVGLPPVGVVQGAEDRLAGDPEPAPLDLVAQPRRVGRQVAVGTQLQPPVPGLGKLVQEPVPGRLVRVVGEPDAQESGQLPSRSRDQVRLGPPAAVDALSVIGAPPYWPPYLAVNWRIC
jgi:hypothetical protein